MDWSNCKCNYVKEVEQHLEIQILALALNLKPVAYMMTQQCFSVKCGAIWRFDRELFVGDRSGMGRSPHINSAKQITKGGGDLNSYKWIHYHIHYMYITINNTTGVIIPFIAVTGHNYSEELYFPLWNHQFLFESFDKHQSCATDGHCWSKNPNLIKNSAVGRKGWVRI